MNKSSKIDMIWSVVLEKRFMCGVARVSRDAGRLRVVDMRGTDPGALILDREVTLSYGAILGPDAQDVADWQDLIVKELRAQNLLT